MPAISRVDTAIIRGPAIVQYNSQTLYSKDDIQVKTNVETFGIDTASHGTIDERIKQVLSEISFTPHGAVTAGILGVLYPHTACLKGTSALPATDKDIVIWPMNGKEKLTLKNAYVSKMPDLFLSATKTAFGSATFKAIGKNSEAWSTAEHFMVNADAAFTDTSLGASTVMTVPYTAALGSLAAPWNSIYTREGFTLSFNVGLKADEEDSIGIYDDLYDGNASVSVKFKPIGIKVADLMALAPTIQGSGAARGTSATANKAALVITGGSGKPTVTVNNCLLKNPAHTYGVGDRVPDLELVTFRNITANVLDALFSIGIAASGVRP